MPHGDDYTSDQYSWYSLGKSGFSTVSPERSMILGLMSVSQIPRQHIHKYILLNQRTGSQKITYGRLKAGLTLMLPRPWLAGADPTLHIAPVHASYSPQQPSVQLKMHHELTLGSSYLLPPLQRIGYPPESLASRTDHGGCLLHHSYRSQVYWCLCPIEKQDIESVGSRNIKIFLVLFGSLRWSAESE